MRVSSGVQGTIKPITFDGEIVWSNYRRQLEAATESNGWNHSFNSIHHGMEQSIKDNNINYGSER